ncbi:hypothetical protein TNCT_711092 [Trichonephila clavata]|uniref:Uncharacterized protein n=1 Tax=Trichonephila clavata TaxID=2740835 RepID=A0A8X6IMY6_TRICU|nr:hypothetical protein TNCT_711092 [Trichonephila clavata]
MDFLKREENYREAANLVNKNNQRQEFPKQEQSRRYNFNYRNKPTGTASALSTINSADVLWSITSSEIKRINKSCVAIETAFGWCLSGTFRNEKPLTCEFMNVTSQLTVDLDKSVKSFWELKSIGMNETNDSSSESEKALQIFDSLIILKEKRYKISLPWKEENIKLNENFYVDDFICSVDSDEEARQVYHEAKLILSEASMNLTKWKTNSNALKEEIETVTSKEAKRLAEKQAELECKMCITDEKFRQLREILNSDDWDFVGDGINQPVSDSNLASLPTVPSILKMPKSTLEIPSETRFLKTRSSSNFIVRNMEPSIRDAAKIFEKENMPPFPFSKRTASESQVHPSKIAKTG